MKLVKGMVRKKALFANVQQQPMRGRDLLFLSAWCGLAAGLLEVGTRVLCRAIDPSQRLYLVSHHFIWLSPLSNLAFFMVIGLVLAVAIRLAPRATGWFGPRLICACTILPVLIAAEPRIYTSAWLLVSLGRRRVPGPYLRAASNGVTNLARLELSIHARSGLRARRFRLRRGLAEAGASQAARCHRPIRPTSFSSCWTRCGQTV